MLRRLACGGSAMMSTCLYLFGSPHVSIMPSSNHTVRGFDSAVMADEAAAVRRSKMHAPICNKQ